MFKFEELAVWRRSKDFAHEVYRLAVGFPASHQAVRRQLQRAALSISLNIAEGAGRKSDGDFKRYLHMSNGSLNETVTLVMFARDESLIDNAKFEKLYAEATEIAKMLSGLERSLT